MTFSLSSLVFYRCDTCAGAVTSLILSDANQSRVLGVESRVVIKNKRTLN
jgi:hypothetical protein